MSIEAIEQAIPHRPPMRLIDEICEQSETTIVCKKSFSADEFFVQGHFPGQPIVPGVIQCECCLQAGAVLLHQQMDSAPGSVPVATRMDSVKFKRMIRPGDTVEIHVTLNDQLSNAYYLTGKMLLDGKMAMRLDFAVSVSAPEPPATGEETQR
ncbi:3-hydroxyacyl-ACP dehydratase FabZ family protein [Stieleria sp.]|uniref:3-hydroxyacyl-ACP dehydratase FabZ family protein n=1 Tax=Stieleria sp. TaxID=2795976 RepID=UPI00356AD499